MLTLNGGASIIPGIAPSACSCTATSGVLPTATSASADAGAICNVHLLLADCMVNSSTAEPRHLNSLRRRAGVSRVLPPILPGSRSRGRLCAALVMAPARRPLPTLAQPSAPACQISHLRRRASAQRCWALEMCSRHRRQMQSAFLPSPT